MIKMYLHTKTIFGKYEGQHDHTLDDDNLQFLRLLDGIRVCLMEMIHMGIDSKAIVSATTITSFPEPMAIVQLKVLHESWEWTDCDYYITMHDISCICVMNGLLSDQFSTCSAAYHWDCPFPLHYHPLHIMHCNTVLYLAW